MRSLEGLRVLDLTHMLSGPYAAMMLADLGAETIKIEPPEEGEGTRKLLAGDPRNSRHGMGAYFLTLNRNKKSVTLDLKHPRGQALFRRLVEESDVVIYNFAVGVAERLGVDHATLSALNPRIVTCSITGFGETGPHRDWVSFDLVAQGAGGGMSITGRPGDAPTRSGIPIGDLGGGVMGVIGVLAALQARVTTGQGQHVDISMQDAQVSLLNYMATMYFLSGEVPGPLGNSHFVHVPYGTFPTADGWIIIAVIFDGFWAQLVKLVELPELDTPANRTQPGRWADRERIERLLSARLALQPSAYWLERLRAARIPCAPVNDLAAALDDPQTRAREMVVRVPDGRGGTVEMPGNPIKLSHTGDDVFTAPPTLGQHTDEVLSALAGLDRDALATLRAEGVIR
jgi:crotonobetainyl-CoA:carnitine CoA-transferase CaiB-like acyl-CoA transferase